MTHHILYIPGLGDQRSAAQVRIIKNWNKFGVETHFMPVNWAGSESFESKLEAILLQIDALAGPDTKVSLVGVSAGASMAVNAYTARKNKISGIVSICGKLRNPEGVNESYFVKNPAFKKSVFGAAGHIEKFTADDKAKMLTVRSLFDGLIPSHDSMIPGVKKRFVPMILHVPTIFFAITVYKRITISFLKSRAE